MPNLPSETPQWLVLAVVIAIGFRYLGQFLSEASETWAKVLGPLGKRWRARGEQRMQARNATDERRVKSMEEDLAYFVDRAADAERANSEFMDWYNRCDQPFHRDLSIRAAEAGCELPPWEQLSAWRERARSE